MKKDAIQEANSSRTVRDLPDYLCAAVQQQQIFGVEVDDVVALPVGTPESTLFLYVSTGLVREGLHSLLAPALSLDILQMVG